MMPPEEGPLMERRGSYVSRRRFVAGAGALGLLAGCGRLPWQAPPAKVPRVGFLFVVPQSRLVDRLEFFRQGLRELGYGEGQNIEFEVRTAEGAYERLSALAAELVRLPVDIIVTETVPGAEAAQQATATIPIVTATIVDPVATGVVASLARPGGNVTGLSMMAPVLAAKQLELLKETVPGLSRVAVLGNPLNAGTVPQLREVEAAASALSVRLQLMEVRSPNELEDAFVAMTQQQADGLIVLLDATLIDHQARLADLAAKSHLPAVYGLRDYVEAGGLMSYAASLSQMWRRAAYYVGRILKGAQPADLPIEQPMIFELVVNTRAARELGITFPDEIMLQVTEVLE
jgi:putative tryptophan/tyrosine transport system substrate-binding protein